MHFQSPLTEARLLRRYKRFLADVALSDGSEITVHCANPGSMMGVAPEGARCWISLSPNKARKLPYSLELVEVTEFDPPTLIGINTNNPNKIAAEAMNRRAIPELAGYETLRTEVKYGEEKSRIDILLEDARKGTCYVEVKNVHLRRREDGLAEFPDCVTTRGAKHLRELINMVHQGHRAVMLYIVQRTDCNAFSPAEDLDPAYAQGLRDAAAAGVELLCYDCDITTSEIILRKALPIRL